MNNIKYTLILILTIFLYSCTEVPTGIVQNQPPNTFLSLFPDSNISPQKTRIKITWWGDDPDGLISGFQFSFDSTNWTYTNKNDSTFQLTISGNDSTFRFWVSAIDDKGLVDPTPATNKYPVINTPPSVLFNIGTEIADTTFTVASFSWTGTDPDGDNTIKYYHWALNDTSAWHKIPGTINLLTLRQDSGLVINSNNKFFLKAEDIAGSYSRVIKMPDSNKTWYVRQPIGRILILDDYPSSILDNQQAYNFYESALDTMLHSVLDIKVADGSNIPKIKNPMFTETLKLFQCVIWYAGRGNASTDNANFDLAQQTLPFYLAAGGKVFFTTGFPNTIEAQGNIVDFAPIDSVTNFQVTTMTSQVPTIVIDNLYPELQSGSPAPDRVRGVYPRIGSHVIYKLPFNPPYDTNKITICVKDFTNNPKIVFMSVPLHRMNETLTAPQFLRRVINTDFGIR